jgi:hypothetical protein
VNRVLVFSFHKHQNQTCQNTKLGANCGVLSFNNSGNLKQSFINFTKKSQKEEEEEEEEILTQQQAINF